MKHALFSLVILTTLWHGAADCRAASVRFALIEDDAAHVASSMAAPLDRVLRAAGSRAVLEEALTLPCYYSGSDYRFRLPTATVTASTAAAATLETDLDVTLVYPPLPELVEALRKAAGDPATYPNPFSQEVSSRATVLSLALNPQGETLVTALVDPSQGESARWRSTAASVKRLVWDGRQVTVVVIGKVVGGLGRLAAALKEEHKSGPPLIGVSRGTVFGWAESELKGLAMAEALEGLGLRYAGVNAWELKPGDVLEKYRRRHPSGITFLSANIVYSSAPAVSYFPSYAVVDAGGLRVALTAVTAAAAEPYFAGAGLLGLQVADPYESLKALIPRLRREADLVVLINEVNADSQRLRRQLLGLDLILAEGFSWHDHGTGERQASTRQTGRREYEMPLWTMLSLHGALDLLSVEVTRQGGERDLTVSERHIRLGSSFPSDPAFPDFDPENFGITVSTDLPLLPSARRVFQAGPEAPLRVGPREFWNLAASLLAEETGSEAAVIQNVPLAVQVDSDIKEGIVRLWLQTNERAVIARLPGSRLKELLSQHRRHEDYTRLGISSGDKVRLAVGGLGPNDTIHGLAIDDRAFYRVATTQLVADALDLGLDAPLEPLGKTLDDIVLGGLRQRSGCAPQDYRSWMEGRTVKDTGLWRVDFRDVGLNIRNTTVVRDDAFSSVPNSRIQGFNERLVGGVAKTDLEYLNGPIKWTNTLEAEYARSRLQPRSGPAVTNTTANRLMLLTMGTRRVGSLSALWLAQSWGPSLGLQFEGEFEAAPGLRRKKIYSAFPGLELYGGRVVKSLELAANIRRDQSREPVNTQYGLRLRSVASAAVGPKKAATLQGELTTNYFFLTRRDQPQDLRLESELQLKLRIPVWKQLAVAPFLDFYAFGLKTRPLYGYSAMTGISIGFSRLWKPQYEKF